MKRHFLKTFLIGCMLAVNGCTGRTLPSAVPPVQPSVTGLVTRTPLPVKTQTTLPTPLILQTTPTTASTELAGPALIGAAGDQSAGDPYAPELGNTGYDVQHYTLRITLDPDQKMVYGRATIEALSTLDKLGQISLDFIGFSIARLTVDGQPAAYTRENNKLVIDLPWLIQSGESFAVEVTYSGEPQPAESAYVRINQGLTYSPDEGIIFTMSEPDGASRWYPCNDHPRDKATYTTEITVPELMQGISNGTLSSVNTEIPEAFPDGRAGDRYTWEMKQPMATYLATVVVGKFEPLVSRSPNGIQLRTYVLPAGKASFESSYTHVANAIDWMADKFGPYPFDAFGYVTVGGTNFSMETQTMVMESSTMGPDTLIHEMAHQWFGDWVSLDSWADIWRNEGFATYLTALYNYRNDPASLDKIIERWSQYMKDHPAGFLLNDPPKDQMFGSTEYVEGALLAHELHQTMGDQAFYQGLRSYFKTYGGKSASFEQFKAEMEKAYGTSLDEVFAKWFAAEPVQ